MDYGGQWLRWDDGDRLIRCSGWSWPLFALSSHPYQDHVECAHQAVKWKSLTAPLLVSQNSLPFSLCALFMGISKDIKHDMSTISSTLELPHNCIKPIIRLFTWVCSFTRPRCACGQWCISSYYGGKERTCVSFEMTQWPKWRDMGQVRCVCFRYVRAGSHFWTSPQLEFKSGNAAWSILSGEEQFKNPR